MCLYIVLAHPNIKLFLTHCGYNSFLEAVHASVPVLALPLFGDQIVNAQKAVRMGIGVALDKMKMKEPDVIEAVMKNSLGDSKLVCWTQGSTCTSPFSMFHTDILYYRGFFRKMPLPLSVWCRVPTFQTP